MFNKINRKIFFLILTLILLVGCKQQSPQIYQINQINIKDIEYEIQRSIENKNSQISVTQKIKADVATIATKTNTNIEVPEFLSEIQKNAFNKATQIYKYIDFNTLPINTEIYIENNGIKYYEVLENEFYNNNKDFYNDVEKYFSGEIQSFIIDKNTYIMDNNKLYTLDINRERNPYFVSVEYNADNIIKNENPNILEFNAVATYYESGIITEKEFVFQMEYIENNWKFTKYNLLW